MGYNVGALTTIRGDLIFRIGAPHGTVICLSRWSHAKVSFCLHVGLAGGTMLFFHTPTYAAAFLSSPSALSRHLISIFSYSKALRFPSTTPSLVILEMFLKSRVLTESFSDRKPNVGWLFACQDDYVEALSRLHLTVSRAYRVNPEINFEVFIHKVDGLSDDHKIETQRDIHQRANDDLADASLEKLHLRYVSSLCFHFYCPFSFLRGSSCICWNLEVKKKTVSKSFKNWSSCCKRTPWVCSTCLQVCLTKVWGDFHLSQDESGLQQFHIIWRLHEEATFRPTSFQCWRQDWRLCLCLFGPMTQQTVDVFQFAFSGCYCQFLLLTSSFNDIWFRYKSSKGVAPLKYY